MPRYSLALLTALICLVSTPSIASVHYADCSTRTGSNATVIIPAGSVLINGAPLDPSDELAVFTPDGVCAGRLSWEGANAALAIWEDDPTTGVADGFVQGEALSFSLWDASEQAEIDASNASFEIEYDALFDGEGLYQPEAIAMIASLHVQRAGSNGEAQPAAFALADNYPNPFADRTTIEYELADSAPVTIEVFDMVGHKVSTLVDEWHPAGSHRVEFSSGSQLASGAYVYRITAGSFVDHQRMMLIR